MTGPDWAALGAIIMSLISLAVTTNNIRMWRKYNK